MKQLYAIFFALTALLCSCQKSGDEGVSVPIHVTQSIDAKSEVIDTDDLSSEQIKEYPVKGVFLNSIDDFYYYPELDIADLKTKGIDFVNNTLVVNFILVPGEVKSRNCTWALNSSERCYDFNTTIDYAPWPDGSKTRFTYYRVAIVVKKISAETSVHYWQSLHQLD